MQTQIVDTAIKNHFEREEELFKMEIKALCLFFIDRVDKYLKDDGSAGDLAKLFEKLYLKNLNEVLKRDNLDEEYKKYLLKTKDTLKELHSGYFAKSKNLKDEEEAIELILNKKEELLSFDSNLRFIFSQWALQEGWDNPNVMTLCKLAPSNSKISKLQQIGRGLRLAVKQDGTRVTKEDSDFDFINELFVVVPSTESDFVSSIQDDISEHSVKNIEINIDRIKAKDRSGQKDNGKIRIDKDKFQEFKNLWDTLNYDAVVKYDINSIELIKKSVKNINKNFKISVQDIIIKRDRHVEDTDKHDSEEDTITVKTHSIFTVYEFIKTLSNNTKLSIQTIATILQNIKKDKFEQIAKNENLALKLIEDELVSAIYDTIINKISYDVNKIEGLTIDESVHKKITVFAKLPKVNIPTAHGKSYNPDFAYVIEQDNKKELSDMIGDILNDRY